MGISCTFFFVVFGHTMSSVPRRGRCRRGEREEAICPCLLRSIHLDRSSICFLLTLRSITPSNLTHIGVKHGLRVRIATTRNYPAARWQSLSHIYPSETEICRHSFRVVDYWIGVPISPYGLHDSCELSPSSVVVGHGGVSRNR